MPGTDPSPEYKPEDELKDLVKIVTAMKKLRPSGRRWLRDFLQEELAEGDSVTTVGIVDEAKK